MRHIKDQECAWIELIELSNPCYNENTIDYLIDNEFSF